MGHKGGLINPPPGAEDGEPVIQIPVGLPCLKRGHLEKKIKRNTKVSESESVRINFGPILQVSESETVRI